jgi:hypothetical protein
MLHTNAAPQRPSSRAKMLVCRPADGTRKLLYAEVFNFLARCSDGKIISLGDTSGDEKMLLAGFMTLHFSQKR